MVKNWREKNYIRKLLMNRTHCLNVYWKPNKYKNKKCWEIYRSDNIVSEPIWNSSNTSIYNLYIYTLLVWVSGRLFASNKRQNFFGFPLKYIQGENVWNRRWALALYIYTLLVCLSVRLYTINVKTAEPIGHKFFCGTSRGHREGYER